MMQLYLAARQRPSVTLTRHTYSCLVLDVPRANDFNKGKAQLPCR